MGEPSSEPRQFTEVEIDPEWTHAPEDVKPHSLCCDECKALRPRLALYEEALRGTPLDWIENHALHTAEYSSNPHQIAEAEEMLDWVNRARSAIEMIKTDPETAERFIEKANHELEALRTRLRTVEDALAIAIGHLYEAGDVEAAEKAKAALAQGHEDSQKGEG
jgi:hypothetical protein